MSEHLLWVMKTTADRLKLRGLELTYFVDFMLLVVVEVN